MMILGELKASFVIQFAAQLGLGNILLCYAIAVALGHVKPWLPMISDCAVCPPEMFVFRFGVVFTALLMVLQNVMIYLAGVPKSKLALGFGVVGSMALGVVGVVNEDEASKTHSGNS